MPIESPTGALLRVDLDALAQNYRLLCKQAAPAECAGVVKADGYGLGTVGVARRLLREGCRKFFVATLAEVAELRALAPDVSIYVLEGAVLAAVDELVALRATPVLSSLEQIERWRGQGGAVRRQPVRRAAEPDGRGRHVPGAHPADPRHRRRGARGLRRNLRCEAARAARRSGHGLRRRLPAQPRQSRRGGRERPARSGG